MTNPPWLDEVYQRLTDAQLPTSYIRRFTEELSDHFEDLKEETMGRESELCVRMGQPEQVAEAAVTAYRRRSFLGRHPAAAGLVFGVSPLGAMVLLFVLVALVLRLVGLALGLFGLDRYPGSPVPFSSLELAVSDGLFSVLTIIVPAVLAAVLYCWLARRLVLGWKWTLLACAIVALAAMLPCWVTKTVPVPQSALYGVQACFWLPGLCGWSPPQPVWQLLQLLAPWAVAAWFWWRSQQRRPMCCTS